MSDLISKDVHVVVRHASGRQSCWPQNLRLPAGWTATDIVGSRQYCLESIAGSMPSIPDDQQLKFSMMFFGDSEDDALGQKYRLLMAAAKYADENGFEGLWLPERHFNSFGCLYPSPAVLHAAIAQTTRRLRLRAGSVVMPLNDPLRVAEEWSVVDNLSGGRVELAFASGWHADDFVLMPDHYSRRSDEMIAGIESVESLWQGNSLERTNGEGKTISVRTYPTPLQSTLPIWLTAAGNPETFQRAGRLGYGVLTHLFHQDIDQLAANIAAYRSAHRDAGHFPDTARVSVTLHTMVGETVDDVRRMAGGPYCRYLKSNFGLLRQLAVSQGQDVDLDSLSDSEIDQLLEFMFEKFAGKRSLMGTPQSCAETCRDLAEIGVTEIACLMDFGPDTDDILRQLPLLSQVMNTLAVAQPS